MSPGKISVHKEPPDLHGSVVPHRLRAAATIEYPLLEILQRLFYRLHLSHGGVLEKILTVISVYAAAKPVYIQLKTLFSWAFTSQVTILATDPVAAEVITWMSSNVINNRITTDAMIVSSGYVPNPSENVLRHLTGSGQREKSQPPNEEPQCHPPLGKRLFWIGMRPFWFSRSGSFADSVGMVNQGLTPGQAHNSIVVKTLGWSLQPLNRFINECHEFTVKNKDGTTTIHYWNPNGSFSGHIWTSVNKATRQIDTIDMDDALKADLVQDADYYYSKKANTFYADCGIPYRRGYLFHGPPGTGKSSFSAALAGHLQCDMYLINLATGNMNDGLLQHLLQALPWKCVVLIEDIDSAGIDREQGHSTSLRSKTPNGPPTTGRESVSSGVQSEQHEHARNVVTMSGLLNAIDGNAAPEGRLLIMTSNNPEVLDEALTRPGRIDKQVYFGKMVPKAAYGIFKRLIGRAAKATFNYTDEQVEQYATEFSKKLPADTFTPAQVQNYLQDCRGNPKKALQELSAWVDKTSPSTSLKAAEEEISRSGVPATSGL